MMNNNEEVNQRKKIISIPQLIFSVVYLIMILALYSLKENLFNQEDTKEILRILSDGFIIAGIIYICVGLLTLVAKSGLFDILGYAFRSLGILFTPSKKAIQKRKTYYEYKKEKEEKGRKWHPFFVTIGAAFVLISIIFFILYTII